MSLAGTYECTLKTPMGAKTGTLVVVPSQDGETFTGSLSNEMLGTVEIPEGTIDANMLLCQMQVTSPMKMKVDCEVIIEDDNLVGFIKAGMFGEMPLKGQRVA